MPIVLARVDDRLIHGQVVIGWGRSLGLERIILVDDDVAGNDWEKDLYRMGVPDGMAVSFALTRGAPASALPEWQGSRLRSAILTGNLATMARLHDAAPRSSLQRINLRRLLSTSPVAPNWLPYGYLNHSGPALICQCFAPELRPRLSL